MLIFVNAMPNDVCTFSLDLKMPHMIVCVLRIVLKNKQDEGLISCRVLKSEIIVILASMSVFQNKIHLIVILKRADQSRFIAVKNFNTYIDGQVWPVIYQQFWIQYGTVAIEVIKKYAFRLEVTIIKFL